MGLGASALLVGGVFLAGCGGANTESKAVPSGDPRQMMSPEERAKYEEAMKQQRNRGGGMPPGGGAPGGGAPGGGAPGGGAPGGGAPPPGPGAGGGS